MIAPTDLLGTLPQWITAISTGTVATCLVALVIGYWRRGVSLRTIASSEGVDIRKHYAEELARVAARQRECEEREHALRHRVVELENDVLGLIRIIAQASADKVLHIDAGISDEIRSMAERVHERRLLDEIDEADKR